MNSSLISSDLFLTPSSLFFLEARLIVANAFQKERFISELGLSMKPAENLDIAMFTRTSGVLFIAGIGSYCVYRLGRRLFGQSFGWTLFDFVKCDLLAHADSRLLHPAAEGYYKIRIGEDDLQELQKYIAEYNKTKAKTPSSISSSNGHRCSTAFQRLIIGLTEHTQNCDGGLAALLTQSDQFYCQQRKSESDQFLYQHLINNELDNGDFPSTSSGYVEAQGNIFCRSMKKSSLVRRANNYSNTYHDFDDDNLSLCSDLTSVSRVHQPIVLTNSVKNSAPLQMSTENSNSELLNHLIHSSSTSMFQKQREQSKSLITEEIYDSKDDGNNGSTAIIDDADDNEVLSQAASTSLRIIWQGEQFWDDEFFNDENVDSVSGISDLSAFKNLQEMFQQREQQECNPGTITNSINTNPTTPNRFLRRIQRAGSERRRLSAKFGIEIGSGIGVGSITSMDALSTTGGSSTTGLIDKCIGENPNYLYRSAIVERSDFAPSEVTSVCSSNIEQCKSINSIMSSNLAKLKHNFRNRKQLNEGKNESDMSSNSQNIEQSLDGLWVLTTEIMNKQTTDSRSTAENLLVSPDSLKSNSICQTTTSNVSNTILSRSDLVPPLISFIEGANLIKKNSTSMKKKNQMSDSCFSKSSYGSSIASSSSVNPTALVRQLEQNLNDDTSALLSGSSTNMFDSAIVMSESISSGISDSAMKQQHQQQLIPENYGIKGQQTQQPIKSSIKSKSYRSAIDETDDLKLFSLITNEKIANNALENETRTPTRRQRQTSGNQSTTSAITLEWF